MADCIDPNSLILFPDLSFKPSSVHSVTSESGPIVGPVVPGESNYGRMTPIQSGTPTASAGQLEIQHLNAGDIGSAPFVWRKAGDADENWRGTDQPNRIWGHYGPFSGASHSTNNTAFYASKFNRIVAISNLDIKYRDVDAPYDTWSSTTWQPLFSNANDTLSLGSFSLDATELEDGTILMAALIARFDASNPTQPLGDFDLYRSEDGGLTWTRSSCNILNALHGNFISYEIPNVGSKFRLTRSGRYLRLTYIYQASIGTSASVHTLVSNDEGSTWRELTVLGITSAGTNQTAFDIFPHDVAGSDDGLGTFVMLTQITSGAYSVHRSSGFDDWVNQSSVTPAPLLGDLYSIGLVHHQGWFIGWLWDNDESSTFSNSGVVVIRAKVGEEGLGDWEYSSPDTHVARLRVQAPSLVSAGPFVFGFGHLQDLVSTAIETQPFSALMGGWTQRTMSFNQSFGWGEPMAPALGVMTAHWASDMGPPAPVGAGDVNPKSDWTLASSGTGTQLTEPGGLQITTNAPAESFVFNKIESFGILGGWAWFFSLGSTFYTIMATGEDDGKIASSEIGFSITSSFENVANSPQIKCTVRIAHDALALFDDKGATLLWSDTFAANTFADFHEFRLVLSTNQLDEVSARLLWRRADGYANEWEESDVFPTLTQVNEVTPLNRVEFGHLGQTQATAMVSYWREVGLLGGDAKYRLGGAGSTSSGPIMPGVLNGFPSLPSAAYIDEGRSLSWGGAAGQKGDEYTMEVEHAHPIESIFHPSPRIYWESTDFNSQELIFDIGEASRWQVRDIALIGINTDRVLVEFDTDPAFPSPSGEVTAFSYALNNSANLIVLAMSGNQFQYEVVDSDKEAPVTGTLVGKYATNNTSGGTFLITKDYGDRRLHLETGGDSLSFLGWSTTDEIIIYDTKIVFPVPDSFATERYMRLTFSGTIPSLDPVYRVGTIVAGHAMELDVPLEWTQTDNSQPNTTQFRTRSAIQWAFTEGPPQRTFSGRVIGDAVQLQNEEFRGRLSQIGYDQRPIVLILDDADYIVGPGDVSTPYSAIRTMIYGRLVSGAQLEKAAWFTDEANVNRQAGDVSMVIVEEV